MVDSQIQKQFAKKMQGLFNDINERQETEKKIDSIKPKIDFSKVGKLPKQLTKTRSSVLPNIEKFNSSIGKHLTK